MSQQHAAVRVPGSTSNLGGGFDCVGMAVDCWLSASVTVGDGAPSVTVQREGALRSLVCEPRDDLLYAGFAAACASRGRAVPPVLEFTANSEIPVARGLGSSAAALVAGAALADVTLGLALGREGVALLVSQIEGHPDNAAPAAFGGAMLGVARDDATDTTPCTYAFSPLPVHDSLAFVFVVPPYEVTTAEARAVLPKHVSFSDAVCAVQRSAALVHGLATGDDDLLARALDDVLHVPYRRQLIPGYDQIVAAARAAGAFGATLSGSGSAMLAIGRPEAARAIADAMTAVFAAQGHQVETLTTAGVVGGLVISGRQSAETSPVPAS